MSDVRPPIPQPTPASEAPAPEPPPHLRPREPGVLRVLAIAPEGGDELAALYKATYRFDEGGSVRPADEPEPLDPGGTPHDPLEGREGDPSWRSLPELVGWKTGTDVVVQGSARPPRPTAEADVAVSVGSRRVVLRVTGPRVMDRVRGSTVFSDPEAFEAVPLRWENAYGGRDRTFEAEAMTGVDAEDLRRVRAAYQGVYGDAAPQPIEYPRNRFGMGWVLGGPEADVEGRELPMVERVDDLLTPERAVVANPFRWAGQPIPGGFDHVEPTAFPRSAMIGLPPASAIPFERFPEVERGHLPPDFCRGNALAAPPERYPSLLHPLATRCAAHGLQLPFMRGDEAMLLEGMDAAHPKLRLSLPRVRPVFAVPFPGHPPMEVDGALLLVSIDVDARALRMIWSARISLASALPPGRGEELEEEIGIQMRDC